MTQACLACVSTGKIAVKKEFTSFVLQMCLSELLTVAAARRQTPQAIKTLFAVIVSWLFDNPRHPLLCRCTSMLCVAALQMHARPSAVCCVL